MLFGLDQPSNLSQVHLMGTCPCEFPLPFVLRTYGSVLKAQNKQTNELVSPEQDWEGELVWMFDSAIVWTCIWKEIATSPIVVQCCIERT